MTTRDRLTSALYHLNTFVRPGADDLPSVDYVAAQIARAIEEETARETAETARADRLRSPQTDADEATRAARLWMPQTDAAAANAAVRATLAERAAATPTTPE